MTVALLAFLLSAEPTPNCEEPTFQQEMNECMALSFARADAELNKLWPEVIASMRRQDEYTPEWDKRPSGVERLRESQRAWITLRDAHCAAYAYQARGGTMEPMLYESCRSGMTEKRIGELRDLIVEQEP